MRNTNWEVLQPTREDWLRLAAFIDGEGSILINRKGHQDNGRTRMSLRVILVNTDPRMPVWCRDTFGGTLVFEPRKNPKHRDAVRWHVSCKQAEWVLKGCLEFFLIKGEEAAIGLAFRETFQVNPQRAGLPLHVHDLRKKLREDLHARKRIGPNWNPIIDDERGMPLIN